MAVSKNKFQDRTITIAMLHQLSRGPRLGRYDDDALARASNSYQWN